MRVRRWAAAITAMAALAAGPGAQQSQTAPAKDRVAAWQEDVDVLVKELPAHHKNLFFKLDKDQFESRAAALRAKCAELTDTQILAGMMALVAAVGDGHTALRPQNGSQHFLPVGLRFLKDGWYITATPESAKVLLGKKLAAVDDTPADKAEALLAPMVSCDNVSALHAYLPNFWTNADYLVAVGVAHKLESVKITAVDSSGKTAEAEIPSRMPTEPNPEFVYAADRFTLLPNWHRRTNYEYEFLDETGVMYLAYNSCRDDPSLPMADFARRFLADVDRHKPRAIVIDLRNNGGGSSPVFRPILDGLSQRKDRIGPDRCFTIIGRGTFSSGMINAIECRNTLHATLVGEPTGGRPNHYGEQLTFRLPNCKAEVAYSSKHFVLVDGDPLSVEPDILAVDTPESFFGARDVAMEAIYAKIGKR